MSLVDRVKNILLSPKTEWGVIATEPATPGGLLTGYVIPLAAVAAIASFIGLTFIGVWVPFGGRVTTPIVSGLVAVCVQIIMTAVGVFILSLIIDALAPTFGGQKNSLQALKVAAYTGTPAWVAGVLGIIPVLGVLAIIGALYALYLLYLGLPTLMKSPVDKAPVYTAVVAVTAFVLFMIVGLVGGAVTGIGMLSSGMFGGGTTSSSSSSADVKFDKNSTLGRLQELSSKMEESGKKMDEAAKTGDTAGQTAAAFDALGTLLGGGKRVDPLAIEVLRPFVPETFAGLPKTRSNAEKNGMAGMMVSKAEADYGAADKQVNLEISDTGGVSGLMGFASWANMQGEKDDESGTERTQKVGGRLVHERQAKNGGANEYSIVLGDRFIVSAKSSGLSLNELKSAVSGLDLGKLEGMKDVGVTK